MFFGRFEGRVHDKCTSTRLDRKTTTSLASSTGFPVVQRESSPQQIEKLAVATAALRRQMSTIVATPRILAMWLLDAFLRRHASWCATASRYHISGIFQGDGDFFCFFAEALNSSRSDSVSC